MEFDSRGEPGAKELRFLAAQYRARAETSDPEIAKILTEIADDLDVEVQKLDAG